MNWLSYLWIIPILLLLVVAHELGHFLTARLFGVRVLEFAFGFPPRLFSVRRGETTYAFNALPIGGYVRMEGEDGRVLSSGSFPAKPGWQRAIILTAGVAMNVLLVPVLLTTVAVMGEPQMNGVRLEQVQPGSAAASAGLKAGEIIWTVDGAELKTEQQFIQAIDFHLGSPLTFLVSAPGAPKGVAYPVIVTPRAHVVSGQGHLGVTFTAHLVTRYFPLWQAPVEGVRQSVLLITSFFGALHQAVVTNAMQLSGPVVITKVTGEAAQAGASTLIELTALLSINLAVMNLLPFPALDGGRLAMLLVEGVRRRRLDPHLDGTIHFVGLIVLMLLMLMVSMREVLAVVQ
ncbi:MAG: M50 family metallopeptidase [Chloroflexi bacterium]|nr:M50 family metallopeptidase [Chloroflexota bacterium]